MQLTSFEPQLSYCCSNIADCQLRVQISEEGECAVHVCFCLNVRPDAADQS